MEFQDIAPELHDAFSELLEEHLRACLPTIAELNEILLPMTLAKGVSSDYEEELKKIDHDMLPSSVKGFNGNLYMSYETEDGQLDVDAAYVKAINILKNISFERAVFSYGTQLGSRDRGVTQAIKSFLIDKSGIALVIFSPYVRVSNKADLPAGAEGGIQFGRPILFKVIENIFDGENYN